MENYAVKVLQQRVDEINVYIEKMKSFNPEEYKFMPDYDNLKKKRRHLQRVIAIVRLMDLNAI